MCVCIYVHAHVHAHEYVCVCVHTHKHSLHILPNLWSVLSCWGTMNGKWSRKNPVLHKWDVILKLQGFLNWLGWGQELKRLSSNSVCKNIFWLLQFPLLTSRKQTSLKERRKPLKGSPVQEDRILFWTFERKMDMPDAEIYARGNGQHYFAIVKSGYWALFQLLAQIYRVMTSTFFTSLSTTCRHCTALNKIKTQASKGEIQLHLF